MSTATFTRSASLSSVAVDGPALVSELPGATATATRPGLLQRLREDLAVRREARAFERALGASGHAEAGDLLALRRRS